MSSLSAESRGAVRGPRGSVLARVFLEVLRQDVLLLDLVTQLALRAVCRELRLVVGGQVRGVRALRGTAPLTAALFPRLERVSLRGCAPSAVTDAVVERVVAGLPGLTALDLAGCARVTDTALAALGAVRKKLAATFPSRVAARALVTLDLTRCTRITDVGVSALASLTTLATLRLGDCLHVTDAALQSLVALTALTALDLHQCRHVTDAGLASLTALPSLADLSLRGCRVTDAGVSSSLLALTALTALDLRCHLVSTAALPRLAACPALHSLSLNSCRPGHGVDPVVVPPALTRLDISGCSQIPEAQLLALASLPRLASLDLSHCRLGVTDGLLAALAASPSIASLTSLNIAKCNGLTANGLASLTPLAHLASLNLDKCNTAVTDATLVALAHSLTVLTALSLQVCRRVSLAGLRALATLPHLTDFNLAYCNQIEDDAIKALTHQSTSGGSVAVDHGTPAGGGWREEVHGERMVERSLTRVDLAYTGVTDVGVAALASLPCLTSGVTNVGVAGIVGSQITGLSLRCNPQLNDSGLCTMGMLSGLASLDLGESGVGDAALASISSLTGLTSLHLGLCRGVTDCGLASLSTPGLPNLLELNLKHCTQVTDVGVASLACLVALTFLDLSGCNRVSDAGLRHLAPLDALESLHLVGTRLTDAGLAALAPSLFSLRFLNLIGCSTTAASEHALSNR
eukprot:gene22759-27478_t